MLTANTINVTAGAFLTVNEYSPRKMMGDATAIKFCMMLMAALRVSDGNSNGGQSSSHISMALEQAHLSLMAALEKPCMPSS